MESYQLIENKALKASEDLREQMALYIGSFSVKHRNTIHASFSFTRGSSLESITQTINMFLEQLAKQVGCNLHGLSVAGVMIQQNEPVIPGMVDAITASHAHLIVRSVKARATGRTVSRLPVESIRAIEDALHGTALDHNGISGEPFVLVPVHDLPGLLDYIGGEKNAQAPGARVFTINQKNLGDKFGTTRGNTK